MHLPDVGKKNQQKLTLQQIEDFFCSIFTNMKFYSVYEKPGQEDLLSGLAPHHFEEALQTGSCGTLAAINHQLVIKIRFKPLHKRSTSFSKFYDGRSKTT